MNSSNFGNIYIAIAKDTKKGYSKEKDKFQCKYRACKMRSNFLASLLYVEL